MPAARIVSASVQRADSLRSERSDASQTNKRVSFNRDVDVKHINHPTQQQPQQQQQQYHQPVQHIPRVKGPAPAPPVGSHNVERHDPNIANAGPNNNHAVPPFYNVYKEPTLLSEAELAQEAERIIQQVDQISCTVASPNPHLLANYETRSLERRNLAASKRNNQIQGDNGLNWSRTLPTTSTKNQLLNGGGEGSSKSGSSKKAKNIEQKNNILHQQQQQQQQQQFDKLDPIIESSPRRPQQLPIGMMTVLDQQQQRHGHHNNRDKAPTTPPKYDSGIEMEATSRPNVNLIVQQLTEESRQRELLRRQYQEELNFASEDPLAPRLPTLNLIEPDPQFGLSHNKNLPFSYTGGVSPTRISPLRASPGGPRFTSPPPPRPELPSGKVVGAVTDVVYAQVKTSAQQQGRSQSPERNVYRSSNGDKVPAGRGKLFQFQEQQQQQQQQSEVIRQHLRYPIKGGGGHDDDEEEEPEGPVDEEDLDAIKAKARFLFGDDGQGQQTERKLSGSSGNSRGLDTRNNNRNNINNSHVQYNNNNNNASGGLSFKYSTLLKDQQQQQRAGNHQEQPDRSYQHTTKILIAGNEQQQQQQQQRKQTTRDQRVFQYSDDEDDDRFGGRVRMYQDRSVSPEPRIQPLTNRIRSLQMQQQQQQQQQQSSMRKSPERSYQREPESRTLPLPEKKNQMSMTSTRLIQEAERGRTVVRHRTEPIIHSSRLTQFQSRYEDEMDGEFEPVAPKPPLRIKKLSRERMEASPPRQTGPTTTTTQNKVAFNTVPWRHHDRSPESSPERSYPLNRPLNYSSNNKMKMPSPYRYQPPRSSLTPSPERRISSDIRHWNEPIESTTQQQQQQNNNKLNNEPEKQEKIRRQRSKFLSVFLGSKANKSEKKASATTTQKQQQQQQSSVFGSPVAPAASVVIKSGPAVKEVRGQAPPQVAKWSPEDEAELVRQSRSLLVKGQSHQSNQTTTTSNNNNNNNNNIKMSTSRPSVVEPSFIRKTVTTTPPAAGPVNDPSALRYRVVTTTNGSKDGGHRRRSSTDRTDTSESDSHVHNQRSHFKNLRQKSQSFNNLNYRPDPVVVLSEEHQHNQNRRHQDTSVQFQSSRRYPEDGGRYKPQQQIQRGLVSDARPYASTNLIHQIGVESSELRDDPRQRGPVAVPSVPLETAPAPPAVTSSSSGGAAAPSRRQMRYFGDTDLESQPSRGGGGYSSRYMPKAKVLRSASSAAGMGAVRRGVLNQRGRHHPVSSVNSSESDGSAMQSAAGSAESQRSVYLHATTVADIPVTGQVHGRTSSTTTTQQQLQAARRHKAQSREDMSALSGATGSTLRRTQTRQISRSYSVLAPWKPRHYRDKYEITYSNQQQPGGGQTAPAMVIGDVGKPPRAPIRRREDVIVESEDSADVYRPSATVGQRQTSGGGGATTTTATSSKSGGTSVSRSSTMPKNSKLMAGWFRKKKR